jgi:hypothetical protein
MTKRRIHAEPRRYWTEQETARLVAAWAGVRQGTRTARQVLAEFPGRTLQSIRSRISMIHQAGQVPQKKLPDNWQDLFRQWNAQGWTDADIANETQVTRRYVSFLRKEMGLPDNNLSQLRIERVKAKTREQLAAAGCASLGEVRATRFRQFAVEHGWPEDLRVRGVQILELLLIEPALTRREISDRLGLEWKGARKSLVSNDPEGSYLANLAARGLVIKSPRVASGETGKRKRHGKTVCYYSASPLAHQMKAAFLQRRCVEDQRLENQRSNGHVEQHKHRVTQHNVTDSSENADESGGQSGRGTIAGAGSVQADRRSAGRRRRQTAVQGRVG